MNARPRARRRLRPSRSEARAIAFEIKDERDLTFARDVALLAVNGFNLPTGEDFERLARRRPRETTKCETGCPSSPGCPAMRRTSRRRKMRSKPGPFSSALISAIYGEVARRHSAESADINYLLSFRDGEDVPAANRADVAMLIREGALTLFADATLKPRETMPRGRALHAIAANARIAQFASAAKRHDAADRKWRADPAAQPLERTARRRQPRHFPFSAVRRKSLSDEIGDAGWRRTCDLSCQFERRSRLPRN